MKDEADSLSEYRELAISVALYIVGLTDEDHEVPDVLFDIISEYMDPMETLDIKFEELVDDIESIFLKELKLERVTIH